MIKKQEEFIIKRYDSSKDQSLRPYSAADEYLLRSFNDLETKPNHFAIYNDRFGYLACSLNFYRPTIIVTNKSQEHAIHLNHMTNKIQQPDISYPLVELNDKLEFALVKIPKSLALFELFINHIARNSTEDITVVLSFMTRHFSSKYLEVSQKYFEEVEQSKAVKKSRLITLTKKKAVEKLDIINVLNFNDHSYKQYWGVFSGNHIDYATQFFIDHIKLEESDKVILDLASGNGVIAKELSLKMPNSIFHLLDDSYLAVESAKLNIQGEKIRHHYDFDLSSLKDKTFDLIVSNPPFHFEYEINIEIPIQLFKGCYRCLKKKGSLQIVANKHLNYITHLKPIFSNVTILSESDKFVVYMCVK